MGQESIATTSIDTYAAEQGIARVGLIMLDLEGSELEVLRGGETVIRRDGPALVFEVHSAYLDWSRGLPETGYLDQSSMVGLLAGGVLKMGE